MDKVNEEYAEEARKQVAYEKNIVDTTVMKSKYVVETLQAAGYCEEHVERMIEPVLLASILQQFYDVFLDMQAAQEAMLKTQQEISQQLEIIDNSLSNIVVSIEALAGE